MGKPLENIIKDYKGHFEKQKNEMSETTEQSTLQRQKSNNVTQIWFYFPKQSQARGFFKNELDV